MKIEKYSFCRYGDSRGMLVAIEQLKDTPFEIRRIYYIFNTRSGMSRGFHAHKSLKQMLICVSGSCKLLLDNGREKENIVLDQPHEGVYVPEKIWCEMYDFSADAVLLVLASQPYDEEDYIRNYAEFLAFVEEKAYESSI